MPNPCDKVSMILNGFSSEDSQAGDLKKACADCGATKTPLWRGGPAGPKSLCNACGIRSRKKRQAILAGAEEKKPKMATITATATSSSGRPSDDKIGDSLKRRLLVLRREVTMRKRSTSGVENRKRRQMGEEEQAAVLLMALSCGTVYA
ncbi:hypothetical protein SAY86_030321 [Trapa natans]|uniref:GATA-type domain-containing protein n=1 Tax=Trapa natans TaxID=22666 RepID=A0AAN7MLI4_TRANT|nr:hypothetical protein SAY86_030321 [Trapa natans]